MTDDVNLIVESKFCQCMFSKYDNKMLLGIFERSFIPTISYGLGRNYELVLGDENLCHFLLA